MEDGKAPNIEIQIAMTQLYHQEAIELEQIIQNQQNQNELFIPELQERMNMWSVYVCASLDKLKNG